MSASQSDKQDKFNCSLHSSVNGYTNISHHARPVHTFYIWTEFHPRIVTSSTKNIPTPLSSSPTYHPHQAHSPLPGLPSLGLQLCIFLGASHQSPTFSQLKYSGCSKKRENFTGNVCKTESKMAAPCEGVRGQRGVVKRGRDKLAFAYGN